MNVGFAVIILLAVIQGITEFFPISSSGHLVVVETLLGLRGGTAKPGVILEVAVHVGTLVAVVIFYRKKVLELLRAFVSLAVSGKRGALTHPAETRYIGLVILATIPAALVGALFSARVESAFDSAAATSLLFMATGVYLLLGRRPALRWSLTWQSAVIIGLAQAVAILPGCSRSGWTITTALLLGIGFEQAAEFSFIISIPAILGALVLELAKEHAAVSSGVGVHLLVGAVVALLAGLVALKLLIRILAKGTYHRFAYYLLPVGAGLFIYFRFLS
jgi:undecaprenyl-diphosphatase